MDFISFTSYINDNIVYFDKELDKKIKDFLSSYLKILLNDSDFLTYDNKSFKISYVKIDDIPYVINVIIKGMSITRNMEYYINLIKIDSNTNPYYLIGSNIFLYDEINTFLTDDIISNKFLDNMVMPFMTLLELILIHKDDSKVIAFRIDDEMVSFIFHMIATIIPKSYLNKLTFSYGGNPLELKNYSKIIYLGSYLESNDFEVVDFFSNDYSNVKISSYVYTLTDKIRKSLSEFYEFQDKVITLSNEYELSLDRALNLYYFKNLELNKILNSYDMSYAIYDSKEKFDNITIAKNLFVIMKKYKIDLDILPIYKYVFKYNTNSRDFIIEAFFNSFESFGISYDMDLDIFYNKLIELCPFDLVYYNYYLKSKNKYKKYLESFDMPLTKGYLLLDTILKDNKYNNISLVPNMDIYYMFEKLILKSDIISINQYLSLISKYNKNAKERIIYLVFNDIILKDHNKFNEFNISFIFDLIINMNPHDALELIYKALIMITSQNDLYKTYAIYMDKYESFFNDLSRLIEKDSRFKNFMSNVNSKKYSMQDILSLDMLDEVYEYYLDNKNKNDYIFNEKLFDYILSYKSYDRLKVISILYNRYFYNKSISYKSNRDLVRRMANELFLMPEELFLHDYEIYKTLVDILNSLGKDEEYMYVIFDLLTLGLKIKKTLDDTSYNQEFFNEYINNELQIDNSYQELFYKSYFKYLFEALNKYIDDIKDLKNVIMLYHNVCNKAITYDFSKDIMISFFSKKDNIKSFFIFSYVTTYSNNNYKNVYYAVQKNYSNKHIVEFINAIKIYNLLSKEEDRYVSFLVEYLYKNSNFFMKIYYKLKYRKYIN